MFSPVFFCEVAAGKKSNEAISFIRAIWTCGIKSIQSIELTVKAMDSDSWETLAAGDDHAFTTDAPQLAKAGGGSGRASPRAGSERLEIVVRGVKPTTTSWVWRSCSSATTGRIITVQANDFSINGYMITRSSLATSVRCGKVAHSTIYLDTSC